MANRREMEKQKVRRSNAKKVAEKQQGGFTPAWLKKLPNGIQMLRLKEEKVYKLDCVPFIVGGENPNADAGMEHFERTVHTHTGIGLDPKAHYLCPLMTSREGKAKKLRPCPVCEHSQKLQLSGVSKEETDPYRPKKRQLLMFVDIKDRERGVQLHEGPYFFGLGQLIDNKMDALDEDSPKLNWWTYDEGMTLHVNVKKAAFKGQSYMKPVDLEIEPRNKQYTADLMEKGCCLDDVIKEMPYDELKELFAQTGSADEDGDDGAKAERNGKAHDDDDDSNTDDDDPTAEDAGIKVGSKIKHKKFGECEVVHVSKDGSSLKLEDEDAEVHGGIAPADCQFDFADSRHPQDKLDRDDDDDPMPPKAKKRHVISKNTDVEDEDEEEDSELDEDSDDDGPDSGDDEPEPIAKKGKTKKPVADDDEDEETDSSDDDEWEDEPDEDEPPAKGKKPAAKPAAKKGSKR